MSRSESYAEARNPDSTIKVHAKWQYQQSELDQQKKKKNQNLLITFTIARTACKLGIRKVKISLRRKKKKGNLNCVNNPPSRKLDAADKSRSSLVELRMCVHPDACSKCIYQYH